MTTAGPVRCPLLIGRDGLLDVAERRLGDVEAGRGQFLLVAGTAGIGKTRFLDAVTQRAEARGFGSVWSAVTPMDRDLPAASIVDLTRAMGRVPAYADLGRDLRALRAPTVEPHHAQRRDLVMEIVDLIVSRLVRPTVIGFEDLQWADDLSLEVIGELARRARASHLLLLGGYRSDEAPAGSALRAWRSTLVTQRLAEELRLVPLSEGETALVTSLILDNGLPAPRDVASAVFARTDGIPLHIEELLGALDTQTRMDGSAIREATVPDTIEDAVISRLGRRSPDAQAAARAGAVIGRSFDASTLAAAMGLPVEALDDPLQELVDSFILEPPTQRGTYDFRHQLLRDAVYRSTPAGDRRRLHARAAEASSRLEGHSVIHASLHYELAGRRDAAFASALEGAGQAVSLSAHREAYDLYLRAVRMAPSDLSPLGRATLHAAVAYEAFALERNDVATAMATTSAAAYREAGRPERAVAILDTVASIDRQQGRPTHERMAAAQEGLAVLAGLEATPAVVRIRSVVLTRLATTQFDAWDLGGARASIAQATLDAVAVGDAEVELVARSYAATVDVHLGDVERGLGDMQRTAAAQEAIGSLEALGTYRDGAELATQHFRYAQAIRWIEDGTRYARLSNQRHCAHAMAGTGAFIDWARGDWDGAVARAEQAVADDGCQRAKAIARWPLGLIALGRGDRTTAVATLEASVAFADTGETLDLWATPWWALAEADLQAGRPVDAGQRCQVAVERLLTTGPRVLLVPFIVTAVRAAVAGGTLGAAEDWLGTVGETLAADPGCAPMAAVALRHGRGLVALAEGSTGIARDALQSAIAGWDQTGRVWEASWARLDLATCLTRTNEFAGALRTADAVRTTALRLGSVVLRERADAIAHLARGHVSDDEPWRPLTAREFEVARLVAEGMTNAEIAEELGIAPKTASAHIEHILAKLGVARRAEIAAWATAVERSGVAVH